MREAFGDIRIKQSNLESGLQSTIQPAGARYQGDSAAATKEALIQARASQESLKRMTINDSE